MIVLGRDNEKMNHGWGLTPLAYHARSTQRSVAINALAAATNPSRCAIRGLRAYGLSSIPLLQILLSKRSNWKKAWPHRIFERDVMRRSCRTSTHRHIVPLLPLLA
jgi:hypothetical protein